MERIRLTPKPWAQRLFGNAFLGPCYKLPRRVQIDFEGAERIPDHPVIFAMNHTDRYNYFPFQYRLWKERDRMTATWVKGKYYESAFAGMFLELTSNLPAVSRGYILTKDFMVAMGRRPTEEEYALLRSWAAAASLSGGEAPPAPEGVPPELLTRPRDMLGRRFDPSKESYIEAIEAVFSTMTRLFYELNVEAFRQGLDLLIFPQGTRSIRLSRGRIGISQIALRLKKTIVPVGCNGSDRVHPGSSPWPKGGRIVYRFGEPITYEQMERWHIDEPFEPFTPQAEAKHRDRFQGLVDHVMERIEPLLDEEYRFSQDRESQGVRGTDRFV
ncbi:MAG: 1-acyl-sn-glycerol-3-phosphate acyltransferase [Myxococcales bacterium]|nr:1-acyl-sn-glycerol-3-phosphate acyltransferase [Myxococcales bacterium]